MGEFPPVSVGRRVWLVRVRGPAVSGVGQTPRNKDVHRGVLPPQSVCLKIPSCGFFGLAGETPSVLERCSSHTHATSVLIELVVLLIDWHLPLLVSAGSGLDCASIVPQHRINALEGTQ